MSASKVVRQYFQAWESKNRDGLKALLAPNFTFNSPVDKKITAKQFFDKCWSMAEGIASFKLDRIMESNGELFVTYTCHVKNGNDVRCTEYFRVVGDQVAEVDVFWGFPSQGLN